MTKTEFVAALAEKTGATKKSTLATVNAFIDLVGNTLISGDDVNLAGFGKFVAVDVAAREARNPQTGDAITVPAHKSVKFKVAKALKDAVR